MGGDEFAISIPAEDARQIVTIVEKLLNNLTVPITINDKYYSLTGSIGLSIALKDGSDADTLLSHSDKAMYHAKHAGKNQYRLYISDIETSKKASEG